jgi:WD40 repeat protein
MQLFLHPTSNPCMIEWRRWEDFSLARSRMFLGMRGAFGGLAASPDGRWLVLESGGQIFLLDWQTGDIQSHHEMACYSAHRLIFDPTSMFVAVGGSGESVLFELWRLDPTEQFVPRPPRDHWPPDQVLGNMALTLLPLEWERIGGDWPARSLPEAPGLVAFSPDSRVLLLPERSGDLVVLEWKVGEVLRRLPTNLGEPIQALAYDRDSSTLWLATEERVETYQLPI